MTKVKRLESEIEHYKQVISILQQTIIRQQSAEYYRSVVYFVYFPKYERIKIGSTKDLETRLRTYRRENDPHVKLLHWVDGDVKLERTIQRILRDHRYKKHFAYEWFLVEPVIEFIRETYKVEVSI